MAYIFRPVGLLRGPEFVPTEVRPIPTSARCGSRRLSHAVRINIERIALRIAHEMEGHNSAYLRHDHRFHNTVGN